MSQAGSSKETKFLHNEFERQLRIVEAYVKGRGLHVREAYDTAKRLHNGKRKGGDPEFSHQVWIAHYILTMRFDHAGFDLDDLIILVLMHDTYEDGYISSGDLCDIVGDRLLDQCLLISKTRFICGSSGAFDRAASEVALDYADTKTKVFKRGGVKTELQYLKMSQDDYLINLKSDPLVALAKSVDRLHNLITGSGVMTRDRLMDYVNETYAIHIPMLHSFIKGKSNPVWSMMIENLEVACRIITSTLSNKLMKSDSSGSNPP